VGNLGGVEAQPTGGAGMPAQILLTAPPLATVMLSNRALTPPHPLNLGNHHVAQQEHPGFRAGGR